MIRSGYLPEDIKRIKDMTKAMMDGLATKGYYEFENGNIISAYIWTKLVDAKTIYGHRLTAQCPTTRSMIRCFIRDGADKRIIGKKWD